MGWCVCCMGLEQVWKGLPTAACLRWGTHWWVPTKLKTSSSQQLCSFKSKIPIYFEGGFLILPGSETVVIPGLWSHLVFPHHRQAAEKAIEISSCSFKKVQETNKTLSKPALTSEGTLSLILAPVTLNVKMHLYRIG